MIKKRQIVVLASCLGIFTANAEVNINGFASIVGGKAIGSTSDADLSANGYDNDIDFKKGSLLALQVSSDLGNGFGVTAQVLSRGDDDWDPNFEWAYVSYDATDNLRFLAGRQRVPFYMYSDFLDVSYAYPWIEPPTGVYNVLFDTFDGLGAIYNFQIGSTDHTLHVVYGGNTDKQDILLGGRDTPETVNTEFNNLYGAAYTFNKDWLTLRTAYFLSDLHIPIADKAFSDLIVNWENVGRPDIADNIRVQEDTGKFFELGAQIDYNDYIVLAEYTNLKLEGVYFGDEESYYVLVGKRFNEYLFHVTYGGDNDRAKKDFLFGDLSIAQSLAPELVEGTRGLVARQKGKSNYYKVGLRYDFHDSASLKFEYTDYSDDINNEADSQIFQVAVVTVF